MLLMLRLAPPVFVNVTVCAALVVPVTWLGNVKLDADRETAAGVMPVPLSVMDCGLPLKELSVMVRPPLRAPVAVGVKVTLMTQLALGANVLPQLLFSAKSPLAMMEFSISVKFPVLLSVTFCAALVEPNTWFPKLSAPTDTVAIGAPPWPLSVTA